MSIVISFGRFAGVSVKRGRTIAPLNGKRVEYCRIILGWVSLILVPVDLDYEWSTKAKEQRHD